MTLPADLTALLAALEAVMRQAHQLGCYRTAEASHAALNIGRAEVWEALPPPAASSDVSGRFTIGPITEQP